MRVCVVERELKRDARQQRREEREERIAEKARIRGLNVAPFSLHLMCVRAAEQLEKLAAAAKAGKKSKKAPPPEEEEEEPEEVRGRCVARLQFQSLAL